MIGQLKIAKIGQLCQQKEVKKEFLTINAFKNAQRHCET